MLHDLRDSPLRTLVKQPTFSLLAVVTLAVGIARERRCVFGYLSTYLWPAVDAPARHEIVRVETRFERAPGTGTSHPDWRDIQRLNQRLNQRDSQCLQSADGLPGVRDVAREPASGRRAPSTPGGTR